MFCLKIKKKHDEIKLPCWSIFKQRKSHDYNENQACVSYLIINTEGSTLGST